MFKKEASVSQILHALMKRCDSWKQLSMKFRLQYIDLHYVVLETSYSLLLGLNGSDSQKSPRDRDSAPP